MPSSEHVGPDAPSLTADHGAHHVIMPEDDLDEDGLPRPENHPDDHPVPEAATDSDLPRSGPMAYLANCCCIKLAAVGTCCCDGIVQLGTWCWDGLCFLLWCLWFLLSLLLFLVFSVAEVAHWITAKFFVMATPERADKFTKLSFLEFCIWHLIASVLRIVSFALFIISDCCRNLAAFKFPVLGNTRHRCQLREFDPPEIQCV
eukprot:m.31526 g.31526  ORF g.31526 m.31526 type:complete len:203 (+) comp5371_c0_seq1:358-966(+)